MAKERPILFTGPMVRAILAGQKTQTRRPVKFDRAPKCAADCAGIEPEKAFANRGLAGPACAYLSVPCRDGAAQRMWCPYGEPGDRLWVRETVAQVTPLASGRLEYDGARLVDGPDGRRELWYRADGEIGIVARLDEDGPRWTPSIHMPRWASRLLLEVTEVRVERLRAISEDDAHSEGMLDVSSAQDGGSLRATFLRRWDGMYGGGEFAQARDPWVWVVTFGRAPGPDGGGR